MQANTQSFLIDFKLIFKWSRWNIDTENCKVKNIHVQPATGMNADSVAEYVLSSSMSLIKKIECK